MLFCVCEFGNGNHSNEMVIIQLSAAHKKLIDTIVGNEKLHEAHLVAGIIKDLPAPSSSSSAANAVSLGYVTGGICES